jgi:hypothetical protein
MARAWGDEYDVPENRDVFIDVTKGAVVKKEDISPLEVIKAMAKRTGAQICDPRPGCKFCYGRGYEGWDATHKNPIPCRCMFRKNDKVQTKLATDAYSKWNREQRRKMEKNVGKIFKEPKC